MPIFDFLKPPTQPAAAPAAPADPPKDKPPENPLEIFSKVFEPPKPAEGTDPTSAGAANASLSVERLLTPESMQQVLDNMNLIDYISQETRAAIAEDPSQENMLKAFNDIGKGAYQQAFLHSATLMEKVLESKLDGLSSTLDKAVQDSLVKNNINVDKAASSNPVVRASLGMIAEKLRATYPDAPPEWITEQSKKWFTEVGKVFSPPQDPSKDTKPPGRGGEDIDWLDFASGDLK